MTFEPTTIADVLVNLFGAGGAIVVAQEVRRSDPKGPVSLRIVFALWVVAALFLTRAWSWSSPGTLADAFSDALASATPLISLIVAEGLLRRHAPRWLKLTLLLAPAVVFGIKLLPYLPPLASVGVLLAIVLGGYLAIAVLLWQRDPATLTTAENTAIRRVLWALVLLAPLIVTDFRSILPESPVRLGALGALLMLYLGLGVGNFHATLGARTINILAFAVIATLFGLGYTSTGAGPEPIADWFRAAATGLAGLLFASLFSESQGARYERTRPSSQLTHATNPNDFLVRLSSHPLLGDAQLLPAAALSEVDHPTFRALLAAEPVLRRATAPWRRASTDEGVERALSLMTAYDATHLATITDVPLRIMALSLPATATDARAETEIEVVRIIAERVYTEAAQS